MTAATQSETRARLQFLTWLRKTSPAMYSDVVSKANQSTLGATEENGGGTSWWQKLATGVMAVGTTYLSLKNQRDALKMNLQRVESGLPPVDTSNLTQPPVIKTQIDLPPEIITRVTESAGQNVNKMLLVGGGIALIALMMMRNQ